MIDIENELLEDWYTLCHDGVHSLGALDSELGIKLQKDVVTSHM